MSQTEFKDQDIQLASFFVRAKPTLRRIGIITAFVLEIVLIVWTLGFWVQSILANINLNASFVRFRQSTKLVASSHEATAASALKILGHTTLHTGNDTADYIALVENPNSEWSANVAYHFDTGGPNPTVDRELLLPGETRVFGQYGLKGGGAVSSFEIDSISWSRVDRHVVANPDQFLKEHNQFLIENKNYSNAAGTLTTDRIMFEVTNQSPYGYFEVGFDVVLYVNGSIVGVEHVSVAPLKTGQKKTVEIHTSPRGITPTDIQVFPHVDIFDEQSYIPL